VPANLVLLVDRIPMSYRTQPSWLPCVATAIIAAPMLCAACGT
jgi:hypothetical protein